MQTEQLTHPSPELFEQSFNSEVLNLELSMVQSGAMHYIDELSGDPDGLRSVQDFASAAVGLLTHKDELLASPNVVGVAEEMQLDVQDAASKLAHAAYEDVESELTPLQLVELSSAAFRDALSVDIELNDDEQMLISNAIEGLDIALAAMTVADHAPVNVDGFPPAEQPEQADVLLPHEPTEQTSEGQHTKKRVLTRRQRAALLSSGLVVGATLAVGGESLGGGDSDTPTEAVTQVAEEAARGSNQGDHEGVNVEQERSTASETPVHPEQAVGTEVPRQSEREKPRAPIPQSPTVTAEEVADDPMVHVGLDHAPNFSVSIEDESMIQEKLDRFLKEEIGGIDSITSIHITGSASAEDESRDADAGLQSPSIPNESVATQRTEAMKQAIITQFGGDAERVEGLVDSSTATEDSLLSEEMDELAGLRDHHNFSSYLELIDAYNNYPDQFGAEDLEVLDGIIGNKRFVTATFETPTGKHTLSFFISKVGPAGDLEVGSFEY